MDRREAILARLLVVAEGITGVVKAARNRVDLSERQRPAIIILDADEQAEVSAQPSGRTNRQPQIVSMTPEVIILLQADSADVGTQLNLFRARWIKAVLEDEILLSHTGPNGGIRYAAAASSLAAGRTMEGEMGVSISFLYPLKTSEL